MSKRKDLCLYRDTPLTVDQLERLRMLLNDGTMPDGALTCDTCCDRFTCISTMDPYNTSGDCLEDK